MLNEAGSFPTTERWTQTDEVQGSSNLQTRVVCCNIQPQAKGKRKHLHRKKMPLRAGACLSTSLIDHRHSTSPGAVLLPSSPGWEVLGTGRESSRHVGKREWKSKSKNTKNTELEETVEEKERTGVFNQ